MASSSSSSEVHEVVIIGAGIAGLATAVALKIMGIQTLILERSPEPRTTGAAILLFANAWRALEALGVAHKLTSLYQPYQLRRVSVSNLSKRSIQVVPFGDRGAIPVHRKVLLEALAEELPPGSIRYSTKLISIKSDQAIGGSPGSTTLHLEDGSIINAKVLIGCDGVHSVVAQWLGLAPAVDSGRSAIRGLAVFPEGHGFKNEFLQFLHDGKRAGFIPLNDKEVYWFLVNYSMAREEEIARNPELILKEVIHHLCKDFPSDYLEVVHHSDLANLTWAKLLFRVPWDLFLGRTHNGCVTVAGDAMHPMTPDLGQGGCTALEDAVVLAKNIGRARSPSQFARGIESYVKERRWRVAVIIAKAYLFGVAQQGGAAGAHQIVIKWFRDNIMYKFLYKMVLNAQDYDCGVLTPNE